MPNKLQALETFREYPVSEDVHEWYTFRCLIQDAQAKLKEILQEFDSELMEQMDKAGIIEFSTGPEERRTIVKKGKAKKDKITNPAKLVSFLKSPDSATREMAFNALSNGEAAWKKAQVKVLCDTLGIEPLVKTSWEDRLEIKAIPQAIADQNKGVKDAVCQSYQKPEQA
jgi:oligoendopeptidase F